MGICFSCFDDVLGTRCHSPVNNSREWCHEEPNSWKWRSQPAIMTPKPQKSNPPSYNPEWYNANYPSSGQWRSPQRSVSTVDLSQSRFDPEHHFYPIQKK